MSKGKIPDENLIRHERLNELNSVIVEGVFIKGSLEETDCFGDGYGHVDIENYIHGQTTRIRVVMGGGLLKAWHEWDSSHGGVSSVRVVGRLCQMGMVAEHIEFQDDHDPEWDKYLLYLVDWAESHKRKLHKGESPACFQEWQDNELYELGEDDDDDERVF